MAQYKSDYTGEQIDAGIAKANTAVQPADLNNYQAKIDSSHKLSADLISDGETNKTVTETEKTTWNGKSVVSGTNDGTNWSTITINGTTKSIPVGGGSSISVKEIDYSNSDDWDSEKEQPTAEVIDDILENKYTFIHIYNIPIDEGIVVEVHLVTNGMVDVEEDGVARYYYKFDEGDEDEGTSPNIEQYLFLHQDGEDAQMIVESFDLGGGSGSSTDVQINGTSITSSGTANIITESAYNASTNKIATMSDIPITSGMYRYIGTAASYANLPTTGNRLGDVYDIQQADPTHGINAGDNVAWTGSSWDNLSGYIDLSAKQDTLVSGTNIKTINNTSVLGSGNININNYNEAVIEEQVYDGYNASNDSSSLNTTAPYVLRGDNYMPSRIYSVKLKIKEAGVLSFGKIKKSDVVLDSTADVSKVTYIETVTLSNTGEQTITFDNTINLNSDEYFVIATSTDTAKFAYGSNGNDKGFYFKNAGTSKWSQSNNSIGISLISRTLQLTNSSIYKGKNISILGDSISTYSGYIPSGNVTYYPAGTIQDVNDTWWKKLIDALDMNLLVNNSWSGSRVTTTDGDTSAGCMTRCQSLHSGSTNPDVIIVWMGINDFNNEVALGTYDGSTTVPSTTTTFREAYGIMLNKILTTYQTSEVWVCTLPQCERNTPTGFPEINGNNVALVEFNKAILELAEAFGVKVLDHNKCGLTYQNMPTYNPDNLHPNKLGHSLIANNDIRQMDNAIRKRY